MFSENLDFIMRLTNTQASILGRACHLNPSHVSRLRGGSRPLPKNPAFLSEMCVYFAKHINADYQKSVMCGKLKIPCWPADEKKAAEYIEKWIADEDDGTADIAPITASFTNSVQPDSGTYINEISNTPDLKRYYYGVEGKREAVLKFFELILNEKTPRVLLLFSDEDMSWLYEDPSFSEKWSKNFTRVLKAGNRVKIIHNVGRRMNEMIEAVSKWMPVYNTGMIEPYYYSRLRDGVFQRTLFIAPGTAAIVSSSVDGRTDGMLNELITDRNAAAALSKEFENYFSLCRPLMHIMTRQKTNELWDAYNALGSTDGNVLCMSDMPTLTTMPEWVAEAMQKRAPESRIYEQWKANSEAVGRLSEHTRYTEILPPLKDEDIPPQFPYADFFGAENLRYTAEEWNAHLENSARFAEAHSNCERFIRDDIPKNIFLFVKECRGVIMTKNCVPATAFAFSEANLVNSFWDYLMRKTTDTINKSPL